MLEVYNAIAASRTIFKNYKWKNSSQASLIFCSNYQFIRERIVWRFFDLWNVIRVLCETFKGRKRKRFSSTKTLEKHSSFTRIFLVFVPHSKPLGSEI